MEIKNVFQMVTINRKLSITEKTPEKGDVSININLQNPPQLIKFKEQDAALVTSTINITVSSIADVVMKGESVLIFDKGEKARFEESIEKTKQMPEDMQKRLMRVVTARAMLLLVKANVEIGIPPVVPLPVF